MISCDPVGKARPLCGFQNPEDLVALPGGASLLVSEYGGLSAERPGAIARLDLASEARTRAVPRRRRRRARDRAGAIPPVRARRASSRPHGIDLMRRSDGALRAARGEPRRAASRSSSSRCRATARGSPGAAASSRRRRAGGTRWRPRPTAASTPATCCRDAAVPRSCSSSSARPCSTARRGHVRALDARRRASRRCRAATWSSPTASRSRPTARRCVLNSSLGDGLRRISLGAAARLEAQVDAARARQPAWGSDGRLYVASLTRAAARDPGLQRARARRVPGAASRSSRVDPETLAQRGRLPRRRRADGRRARWGCASATSSSSARSPATACCAWRSSAG